MKKIFTMFLAAALGGIALSACNSDPAEPLNYSDYKKATIKGKVLVCTDRTVSEPKWAAAPRSIVITARVSNSSLAYGGEAAGYWEGKVNYNATTGEYSVTVPVSAIGSQATIRIKEWTGTVKLTRTIEDTPTVVDVPVIWNTNNALVSLQPGDESIENNLYYITNYEIIEDNVGGNVY